MTSVSPPGPVVLYFEVPVERSAGTPRLVLLDREALSRRIRHVRSRESVRDVVEPGLQWDVRAVDPPDVGGQTRSFDSRMRTASRYTTIFSHMSRALSGVSRSRGLARSTR